MARSPVGPRRRLARALQRLRTEAGQTIDDVARHTEISKSSLSRIENAQISPKASDVKVLLGYFNVPPDETEKYLAEARAARQRGWWNAYADAVPDWFATYLGFETEAAKIRAVDSQLVPGLLQTAGYAKAIIECETSHPRDPELIDRRVQLRMERQTILYEAEPLSIHVIIDESVIRRQVGGREVMREQIARLIEAAHLPNVTLQVIPFSAGEYPSSGTAFAIISFREDEPDVVYVENFGNGSYVEQPPQVARFTMVFEQLAELALDSGQTISLLVDATS
jgi:transcriptional regulator with XRE-family HTH domain